jgi:hypothetical protein
VITLTPLRRRILLAVRDEIARFHFEAGEVIDGKTGRKHTAEFRKLLAIHWIRVARQDERLPAEHRFRTYYRLDTEGEQQLAAVQKGRM